jgi:ribosomal protein L21E
MILKPCLHCAHRKGCEKNAAMLARLRGSGVTMATFRCAERLKGYDQGQRVLVTIENAFNTYDESSYTQGDTSSAELLGTIIGRAKKAGKLIVWLDDIRDTDIKKQAVCLHPDRLTLLGETVPLCQSIGCGRPLTAVPDRLWYGVGCDDERHRSLHPRKEPMPIGIDDYFQPL